MKDEDIIEHIFSEKIVTAVDASGERTKKQDAKTRTRKANQTSSMSKADRKKTARKAAKTKKKDVAGQRAQKKKTAKAMKKRKSMGL